MTYTIELANALINQGTDILPYLKNMCTNKGGELLQTITYDTKTAGQLLISKGHMGMLDIFNQVCKNGQSMLNIMFTESTDRYLSEVKSAFTRLQLDVYFDKTSGKKANDATYYLLQSPLHEYSISLYQKTEAIARYAVNMIYGVIVGLVK